jgi:hypothetical protein
MTEQLLAPLDPYENALTPLFQANIDDAMLREIAGADYGWKAMSAMRFYSRFCRQGCWTPAIPICGKCWS